MKRSIITTIEFSQGHIAICVLENLNGNIVEIYNANDFIKRAHEFLKKSIAEIENKIQGKLQEVTAVIDSSKAIDQKIILAKESIILANNEVGSQDINSLIEQIKLKNKTQNRDVILVQPLRYEVIDVLSKTYKNAPIGKRGKKISALFAVTSVSAKTTDFIHSIIEAHKLKISGMLLKPQILTQNNVSSLALSEGSINIEIGKKYSFLIVNKDGGTVDLMMFYNYGLDKLIFGIAHTLKISIMQAKELMSIYGSIKSQNQDRIIYTYARGIKQIFIKAHDLNVIIKQFIKKLAILAAKYIAQKSLDELPLILSGELTKMSGIENIFNNHFKNIISKYSPMTYVEINELNRSTHGLIYLRTQLSKAMGKHILSIVETNPNKFSTISDKLNERKKGILAKMLTKIGGQYERN